MLHEQLFHTAKHHDAQRQKHRRQRHCQCDTTAMGPRRVWLQMSRVCVRGRDLESTHRRSSDGGAIVRVCSAAQDDGRTVGRSVSVSGLWSCEPGLLFTGGGACALSLGLSRSRKKNPTNFICIFINSTPPNIDFLYQLWSLWARTSRSLCSWKGKCTRMSVTVGLRMSV